MRPLRAHRSCRSRLLRATGNHCPPADPWLRFLFVVPLFLFPAQAQDTGTAATEFYGKGTAVTVTVHDASGNPIPSGAMVKLFHGGTIPAGQAETCGVCKRA